MAGGKRTTRTSRARARDERRLTKRDKFLAELAKSCNVSAACRIAGISRSAAYEWRESDVDFAKAWDEAEQEAADKLEAEAWRRAVEGVEEPVYHSGVKVGTVRKHSDRMLEILLKGHRPERFVDRIKAEHSGTVPVTFQFIRSPEAPDAD